MSVIYIMLPVALLLGLVAVWAFVRAVRGGQFDDLDTPAMRAIQPDEADAVEPGTTDSSAPATSGENPRTSRTSAGDTRSGRS